MLIFNYNTLRERGSLKACANYAMFRSYDMSTYENAKRWFVQGDEICVLVSRDDNGANYVTIKLKDIKKLKRSK